MNHLATWPVSTASAVGTGIARSIRAQATRPDADSPEAWVHFCTTAADEAHAAVLESPPLVRRTVGSAQRLLAKLERMDTAPGAPRLWHDLTDEAREQAMVNGWNAEGWNASQAEMVEDEPGDGHDVIALEGKELLDAAHQAAACAYRACMPKLTGRRTTQAYIACVAVAVQRGYASGSESKALLYTAQLALSAYPSRRAQRGRK